MSVRQGKPAQSHHESIFRNEKHGPLPALLYGLTLITGIVDAISILGLGRVFVANMTGNIVFIGLAAAGAPGFSLGASVVAFGGFLLGATFGGRLIGLFRNDRGRLLAIACLIELALMGIAFIVALATASASTTGVRYSVSILLAAAMGIQNAIARRVAVPDLTTTVLTMTLTGIAADLRQSGWRAPQLHRRLLAVIAMLAGAIVGAVLVIQINIKPALALVVAIMLVVTACSFIASRNPAEWRKASV
jgi:uncharacterized membrane protein YoaK (UPF0700 family)